MTLSTGHPSTLGSYLVLCELFFGKDSAQASFIRRKIVESPNGEQEEVVADETQVLYLLVNGNLEEDTLEGLLS